MDGLTYVLPIRSPAGASPDRDLAAYLRFLAPLVDEVIVVDASSAGTATAHREAWVGVAVRHVPPDPAAASANGKAVGVHTGLRLARYEHVIVADDDVRHTAATLTTIRAGLAHADLVWPQNHFVPSPWHARWDTARTLLNRCGGLDYPGTVGVRRSWFAATGGYRTDVLFENLELLRTVRGGGGRVDVRLDLYVPRRPPSVGRFWEQRVRQAYDSFASPARLALELAVAPFVIDRLVRRGHRSLFATAIVAIGLAEVGRRRAGGRAIFPPTASLWAPAWLLERGICAWLAVLARLRGGVRYRGVRIRYAASRPQRRSGSGASTVSSVVRRSTSRMSGSAVASRDPSTR
jgi:hypothetical protein